MASNRTELARDDLDVTLKDIVSLSTIDSVHVGIPTSYDCVSQSNIVGENRTNQRLLGQ